jgi:hypothetical protein
MRISVKHKFSETVKYLHAVAGKLQTHPMRSINEVESLGAEVFHEQVLPAAEPLVIRGLVKNWPLVQAGLRSDEEFCAHLKNFDRGYPVDTAQAPPSTGGRIFYNEDLSGLNCRMAQASLSGSLDFLLEQREKDRPSTLAVQSVIVNRFLPGLERELRLPPGLVPNDAGPRIWLGNRATIAAHYDPSENIACCVAGTRRFTLFPPEQVTNLYIGPFEITPSGATVSMVDFDQPDPDRFPRFERALEAARQAVLEPGDAIYIPYLWWHHVQALAPINGLVNYWWSPIPDVLGDPRNVLAHAMLSFRALPHAYRNAWRAMFEHYVFGDSGDTKDHIPPERHGILGQLKPAEVKRIKQALSQALSRDTSG